MEDRGWVLEGNVRSETWNLKHVLVVGITSVVLVSLIVGAGLILGRLLGDADRLSGSPVAQESNPIPQAYLPYVVRNHSMPAPTWTPTPTTPPTLTSIPTATPTPSPTFTPVPPPDITLIRGPYVQSVTTDSIIVVWETDLPSHGEVAYGETREYGSSVVDPAMDTRHAVTLTGLAPYMIYHYRLESGGAPLSEDATFRTAAGPNQTRFTFAAFGDTRTQHQFHQAVVERIVAQEPDFALHSGDLVAHGNSAPEWETFFEIEQELMARIPLFPALGNHEGNDPRYFDLFYLPGNERWYTFDYGNSRFISLQVDGFADFDIQSEQYAWLEETLAANTQAWLFVYFHIPPYSSVRDGLEDNVRQALPPLFERYGVDVVFNGHKHNYERNEVNGVTYIVTGGGGAPLYAMQEQEPTQAAFALAYHCVLLEIDGNHLKATVISNEGEVLDAFERSAD